MRSYISAAPAILLLLQSVAAKSPFRRDECNCDDATVTVTATAPPTTVTVTTTATPIATYGGGPNTLTSGTGGPSTVTITATAPAQTVTATAPAQTVTVTNGGAPGQTVTLIVPTTITNTVSAKPTYITVDPAPHSDDGDDNETWTNAPGKPSKTRSHGHHTHKSKPTGTDEPNEEPTWTGEPTWTDDGTWTAKPTGTKGHGHGRPTKSRGHGHGGQPPYTYTTFQGQNGTLPTACPGVSTEVTVTVTNTFVETITGFAPMSSAPAFDRRAAAKKHFGRGM